MIKHGSVVEAMGEGFKFGPDSSGKMVEVAASKEEAEKWVSALKALAEGEEEEKGGDVIRKGWLTREKKKYYFILQGGYLTWYQKEPNNSIPHKTNFVKELTLNSCTVKAGSAVATVELVKTEKKSEKKTESKTYVFTGADADDAKNWVEAMTTGIAAAEEMGLGTGERSKAGLGSRMKKGMAQAVATSKV